MPFVAIENINEFYSQHYLDALIGEDLRGLFATWQRQVDEAGGVQKTPDAKLRALKAAWLEAARICVADRDVSPAQRHQATRDWHTAVLSALGYGPYTPSAARAVVDTDDGVIAVRAVVDIAVDAAGAAEAQATVGVVVIEAPFPAADSGVLSGPLLPAPASLSAAADSVDGDSNGNDDDDDDAPFSGTVDEAIAALFAQAQPPTYVLVLGGRQVVLAERSRFAAGRYLAVHFDELYELQGTDDLRAAAALLAKESLVPGAGETPLHVLLDEASHKHAYGVSQDLKYALREAVELLGNAWTRHARTDGARAGRTASDLGTAVDNIFDDDVARRLTRECLDFLYRLLFLFYAEARGAELGVVPMNSDAFREGYSLEHLRDLELVPLHGPDAQHGTFLHESLEKLFVMMGQGYADVGGHLETKDVLDQAQHHSFRIRALRSRLFDVEKTPMLSGMRIDNATMQRVLELLSLSRAHGGGGGGRGRGRGRRQRQRGRISYARLGINQLGAVYEGLLSYTGFFAREDLYELQKKGAASADALEQVAFAPASQLSAYDDEEFVLEEDPRDPDGPKRRKSYPAGSFIYRLAGRDRERSASYYTPEVLTKSVVKYALQERLKGIIDAPVEERTAHQILELTVCEPAMGSGAFLNEAITQLADAYLERTKRELAHLAKSASGDAANDDSATVDTATLDEPRRARRLLRTLTPEAHAPALRRIRARLATHNVFGVDLNPIAAELAKVSLWLNIVGHDTPVPWLDLQLQVGNSLFGCRRQVVLPKVETVLVGKGKNKTAKTGVQFDVDAGVPVPMGQPLPAGAVWHFLLPDQGMLAAAEHKVHKALAPEATQAMKDWKKAQHEPFTIEEAALLAELSRDADKLWQRHATTLAQARARTAPHVAVFGEGHGEASDVDRVPLLDDCEQARDALWSKTSAGRRLRAVMDLWCALWLWPTDQVDALPDRHTWLSVCAQLLRGVDDAVPEAPSVPVQPGLDFTASAASAASAPSGSSAAVKGRKAQQPGLALAGQTVSKRGQLGFVESGLASPTAPTVSAEAQRSQAARQAGVVDVDQLAAALPALKVAQAAGRRQRFFHWELVYADVFARRGGFDLIVGNPPWLRLTWNEAGILSEFEPQYGIRDISASDLEKVRPKILTSKMRAREYLDELTTTNGNQAFLSSRQCYPLLIGMHTNLYKCFLTRSWDLGSSAGIVALIHQPAIFDDPRGGVLREAFYERARVIQSYRNSLFLFSDIGDKVVFCATYTSAKASSLVCFSYFGNGLHPRTFDESVAHQGGGEIPGIKDAVDEWDLRGHQSRILTVDDARLAVFAKLYDPRGTPPRQARLPIVHSEEMMRVLEQLARAPKLSDCNDWSATMMWNETTNQQDGTIRRDERQARTTSDWIISGPHFYVGRPFNKTPNEGCRHNQDYSEIDLETIPNDYLPRTLYVPGVAKSEYDARTPTIDGVRFTDFFRHVHREMVGPNNERTLVSALIPPSVGHINTVISVGFASSRNLAIFEAFSLSLVVDYFIRSTGKGHVNVALTAAIPLLGIDAIAPAQILRVLRLNCLTTHYAPLWDELWDDAFLDDAFTSDDARLQRPWRETLTPTWQRHCALRGDLERRQALVELDALAALALGLSADELCTIYRVQFPVLVGYERDNRYDQRGRLAPTSVRNLVRDQNLHVGTVKDPADDTRVYHLPLAAHDREADLRRAHAVFAGRLGIVRTTTQPPAPSSAGAA